MLRKRRDSDRERLIELQTDPEVWVHLGGPQQRDSLTHAAHGRHGAEREGLVPVAVIEVLEPTGTRPDGVDEDIQ